MTEQAAAVHNQAHPVHSEWDTLDPAYRSLERESSVAAATDAGQEAPQMPDSLPGELLPPAGLVEQRTASAVEALDVEPSREVVEAVGSYYKDHYGEAALLHAVFQDQISPEAAQTLMSADIPEDSTVRMSAERAMIGKLTYDLQQARESGDEQKIQTAELKRLALAGQLVSGLFNERSIGATTCGDEEDRIVHNLSQQYFDTMLSKGYATPGRHDNGIPTIHLTRTVDQALGENYRLFEQAPRQLRTSVERRTLNLLVDTVPAGRLYYHSTDRLGEIRQRGVLSTRAQQLADYGSYEVNTGKTIRGESVHTDHSRVVHFTNHYRGGRYRGLDGPERAKTGFVSEGTLAFTAAELVKVAPYSVNGAKLGIARLRPGSERPDTFRGSEDEIFYAGRFLRGSSPAEQYSLPIYGKGEDAREVTIIKNEHNLEYERRLNGSEGANPVGEGMPGVVFTNAETRQTPHEVAKLESWYAAQHAGEYIVPLRDGDIDFIPEAHEGSQTDVLKPLRKFALANNL